MGEDQSGVRDGVAPLAERHVVACFLTCQGQILLLKRSADVAAYQERWASIGGPVEDQPLAQAFREIHRKTGISPALVRLARTGNPIEVSDHIRSIRWQVHPYLFQVEPTVDISLTWEHTAYAWIDPRTLNTLSTVPMLEQELARAWDVQLLGPLHDAAAGESEAPRGDSARVPSARQSQGEPRQDVRRTGPPVLGGAAAGAARSATSVPEKPTDLGLDDMYHPPLELVNEAGLGVAVKHVKMLSTGEFPAPVFTTAADGEEALPPGATGMALLHDPVLQSAMAALQNSRLHGVPSLMGPALEVMRLAAERSVAHNANTLMDDLRRVGQAVANLRPSNAGPAHAVAQLLHDLEETRSRLLGRTALRMALGHVLTDLQTREITAASELADQLNRLIPPAATVMTGSFSTTVMETLQRSRQFGVRIIVPEGRPRYEGRLMARALAGQGKSVTLIVDAAVGVHCREADLALIAAETLLADGSIITKTGGYLLALAARAARVPVYAAATLSRLDLRHDAQDHLVLEEKTPLEVWADAGPGVDVRNVYFERIPSELISGVVTEDGLLDPTALRAEVRQRRPVLLSLFPDYKIPAN